MTCFGLEISPPLGPRSIYSPGRFGLSPGFCVAVMFPPSSGTLPGDEHNLFSTRKSPEQGDGTEIVVRSLDEHVCRLVYADLTTHLN